MIFEKQLKSPPPPPPPLCDVFRAGAAVARHFALPKQTPWRRPCDEKYSGCKYYGLNCFVFIEQLAGANKCWKKKKPQSTQTDPAACNVFTPQLSPFREIAAEAQVYLSDFNYFIILVSTLTE